MLISDVYTDTVRRKKMADKRSRKMATVLEHLPAPKLEGPLDAEVTLVGWGSTWGVLTEAVEQLNREGISTSHLQIKFLVPFHVTEVSAILGKSRRVIVVENNQSGQFARHLRAETGIVAQGHIRMRRRAFRAQAHRGGRQGTRGERHGTHRSAVDRARLADGASDGHVG